jgi:hypothetical protein
VHPGSGGAGTVKARADDDQVGGLQRVGVKARNLDVQPNVL